MSHLSFDLPAGRQVEKLLDLSAEQAGGVEVEWKALGDVAKIQRDASPRPIAKYITDFLVPTLPRGNAYGR